MKWNIFHSVLYQWTSLFQTKFLSPGETKPAIWKPSATSSPVSAEELGDVKGGRPSTTFASLMVNKELVCG